VTAKTQKEDALTTLLVERWEQVSRKVAELAEEFPEAKFESQPVAGLRTCGEVVRHVAFWNRFVADSLRGMKADDTANELPLADFPTKASVLEEQRRSSRDVAEALGDCQATLDPKTVGLVITFVEHTSEHYGQLVVYSRLMGIVPPASRV
jgi:uncharacterized damage-inducible protein DinB